MITQVQYDYIELTPAHLPGWVNWTLVGLVGLVVLACIASLVYVVVGMIKIGRERKRNR